MRFWDSSALVPLAVEEASSDLVMTLAESDRDPLVWWATPIEVQAALSRALRMKRLGDEEYRRGAESLAAFRAKSFEVAPIESVRRQALRIVRVHDLRTADALQLAAALTWCSDQPAGLEFVTLDRRLRDAAALEGFSVLPVELPPTS